MGLPRPRLGPTGTHRLGDRPAGRAAPLGYRLRRVAPVPPPASADPQARPPQVARLEAVLIVAEEPLSAAQLADTLTLSVAEVQAHLATLRRLYDADGSAFTVANLAGGHQLRTRAHYFPWLARIRRPANELRLTPALLETLAVVAYKQPATRAEVEAVRGVAVGEPLRQLLERGLIRLAGRQASLGRPQLYATTKRFLQSFGLDALDGLPALAE